jgi:HlyD family secretion protein
VKKIVLRTVLILLIAGAGWGALALFKQFPQKLSDIATTKVRRDDVLVRTYARGELRATRSATLVAPNLFGTVQVTRLAPLGSFARQKDLIADFDDSEVKSRLEEKELEIEQLEEQIQKAEADLAIRNNQDQVDLLSAQYSVRRAELEVQRNELLSAIDAKKNALSLEESRRRLKQLESDIKSRDEQAKAELAVLREKKNQGVLESNREKARLAQVRLLAPISGLVAIKQNRPNFYFPGMQIPDIREGDQLNPGIAVADILDLSELEVLSRVGELDRANLREGQSVIIRLDAIPSQRIKGTIKSMSGTATANVFSGDPAKKFDVVFALDMKQLFTLLGVKPEQMNRIQAAAEANRKAAESAPAQPAMQGLAGAQKYSAKELENAKLPRAPEEDQQFEVLLRPGLLADIEIIVEKLTNVVHIPAQAAFEKDGRLVTYVKKGDGFEERAVTPFKRAESVLVIAKGLEPGEVVALADPNRRKDRKDKKGEKSDALGALPGGSGGGK